MKMRDTKLFSFILIGMCAVASFANATNSYSHLMKVDSLDYSEMVPDGSKVYDSSGKEIPASELKGKYVGVFISASWCGPCRYFGRFLKQYAKKYKNNFAVILIGLDKSSEIHKAYMEEYDGAFYTLAYDHRPQREIWNITRKAYGRPKGAIPLFVLFDENREFAGFIRDELMDDVRKRTTYTPWVK